MTSRAPATQTPYSAHTGAIRAPMWTRAAVVALLLGLPLVLLLPLGDGVWLHHLWPRLLALLVVAWAVPGLLLARIWRVDDLGAPPYWLAAWGLGFCWLMAGALLAHYVPGPLAAWQLWGIYAAGGVLLTVWPGPWTYAAVVQPPTPRAIWIGGALLLGVAVLLRLPGLGYHEFHTDEVVLIRQAAASIGGQMTALAEHTKGPGEITVVLAVYRALNAIDEATARLPFALMSVGSALATGWLGLRLFAGARFARWAGLWAGVLLLGNGFALGLSRIAQYQPGILLLSALAVWAMWEFVQRGQARWLSLAGVFSAFGLLLHYEFGLLAPALLLLLGVGLRRHAPTLLSAVEQRRNLARTVGMTVILAGLLLAVAYVPPLFNPYFSTTQTYLSNRLGATFVFNWPFFVEMGTFYNSTYFFFGLMALALVGTAQGLRRDGEEDAGKTSSRLPVLLLTIWWLPFFVLYIFVVRFPGTHFYQMMTAWSLLAALPLAKLCHTLWRGVADHRQDSGQYPGPARQHVGWPRVAAGGLAACGVAAWLAVSVFYLHLLFFRQNPEYLVNHPQTHNALYWAPYPVPQKPRFGFPIHAGWETIGVLGEWGYLRGTYTSNDRSWGLRNWYRDHLTWIENMDAGESPDYVFSAAHIQEANLFYHDGYHDTHTRIGEVRLRGEPRIELWARNPLPVPYVTFDAEDFAVLFREEYARLAGTPAPTARTHIAPAAGRLGDVVELKAAAFPAATWQRGENVHLTFTWQALTQLTRDYKLFVHVADAAGQPLAQWDGYPGLNTSRTSHWSVDAPFVDHVILPLPPEMPAGEYTLLAGLYDPETGTRLGDRAVSIAPVILE